MGRSAQSIRNVALVGHRGSGKTSLHEALLFEAGVLNRLGSVPDRTTASDTEPDEQARQMSISVTLSTFECEGRKINLLDTPGEPSFVADALGALRVCRSAIFVINAVMGAEVSTQRHGGRRRARPSRGCSSSTCWTASAPTSTARSTRSRPRSGSTSSRPRSRSAPRMSAGA